MSAGTSPGLPAGPLPAEAAVMGGPGSLPALAAVPAESWTATEVQPRPGDELRPGLEPQDVTPGVLGFLVIFVAALVCIPLFRSMTGKIRRVNRPEDDGDGSGTSPEDRSGPRAPGRTLGGPGRDGAGRDGA